MADNLAAHGGLERVEHGDVLVLAVSEPRPVAVTGDWIAMQAKARRTGPSTSSSSWRIPVSA